MFQEQTRRGDFEKSQVTYTGYHQEGLKWLFPVTHDYHNKYLHKKNQTLPHKKVSKESHGKPTNTEKITFR